MARALQAWVQRERRHLEQTGKKPSQRYLRRTRVADFVAEPDFSEALRELRAVARELQR